MNYLHLDIWPQTLHIKVNKSSTSLLILTLLKLCKLIRFKTSTLSFKYLIKIPNLQQVEQWNHMPTTHFQQLKRFLPYLTHLYFFFAEPFQSNLRYHIYLHFYIHIFNVFSVSSSIWNQSLNPTIPPNASQKLITKK